MCNIIFRVTNYLKKKLDNLDIMVLTLEWLCAPNFFPFILILWLKKRVVGIKLNVDLLPMGLAIMMLVVIMVGISIKS
jgi:hypothetical protein